MRKRLGIGIIGYGYIGKVHALAYKTMPMLFRDFPFDIDFVGVATSRRSTAEAAREHGGFRMATDDYRELLARDDMHAVNICTPNDSHRDIALAAFAAGKHVYCDKPLAMNTAEAAEMAKAAETSGLVNMVTFQNRFVPALLRAKQLIDGGYLGRIYQYRVHYLHSGYTDPLRPMSWRLDRSKGGGGALYDLGSHAVDLVRHLLGDFKEVNGLLHTFVKERPVRQGSTETEPVLVDDACMIQARMANGAIGFIEASRFATGSNSDLRIEIHGERGALKFNMMDPNFLDFYDNTAAASPIGGMRGFTRIETVQQYPEPAFLPGPKSPVGWSRFHTQCLWEFVNAIAEGRKAEPDFRAGLAVQAILAAVEESSASGGTWIPL